MSSSFKDLLEKMLPKSRPEKKIHYKCALILIQLELITREVWKVIYYLIEK